jgi:hypothetical protein
MSDNKTPPLVFCGCTSWLNVERINVGRTRLTIAECLRCSATIAADLHNRLEVIESVAEVEPCHADYER